MFLHVIIFLASKRNSCKLQIYIKTVVVNSPSIIIVVEISIPQSNSFFYQFTGGNNVVWFLLRFPR